MTAKFTESDPEAIAQTFLIVWPRLREWYAQGARDLPWRAAPVDPYGIWISEVMSQQSTIKTVIPYFKNWMKRFPLIEDLARAPADEVLKMWAGLGYYSRARNVHATAQALTIWRAEREGEWPRTADEWVRFKGVGPYTAAAVASIAFGDPAVPVDGNVLRVGSRFFGLPDPLNSMLDRKRIEDIFARVIVAVAAAEVPIFGQSLMELGALVCRPGGQALCEICPLNELCIARKTSRVAQWPVPKKRPQTEERWVLAEVFRQNDGQILFEKISPGERLEGQWELPMTEFAAADLAKITSSFGIIGPVVHSITRYKYRVWVALRERGSTKPEADQIFASPEDPSLHLTTLTRKLLLKISPLLN